MSSAKPRRTGWKHDSMNEKGVIQTVKVTMSVEPGAPLASITTADSRARGELTGTLFRRCRPASSASQGKSPSGLKSGERARAEPSPADCRSRNSSWTQLTGTDAAASTTLTGSAHGWHVI